MELLFFWLFFVPLGILMWASVIGLILKVIKEW